MNKQTRQIHWLNGQTTWESMQDQNRYKNSIFLTHTAKFRKARELRRLKLPIIYSYTSNPTHTSLKKLTCTVSLKPGSVLGMQPSPPLPSTCMQFRGATVHSPLPPSKLVSVCLSTICLSIQKTQTTLVMTHFFLISSFKFSLSIILIIQSCFEMYQCIIITPTNNNKQ